MKVIADSSFLIALATIDAFSLLSQIFSEVFIPEAVYDEVVIRGAGLPGAEEVARAAWIKRIAVKDVNKVKAYRAERLGVGESEALALAEELKADLVLVDDERAWQVAQQKGIAYLRSTESTLHTAIFLAEQDGLNGTDDPAARQDRPGYRRRLPPSS